MGSQFAGEDERVKPEISVKSNEITVSYPYLPHLDIPCRCKTEYFCIKHRVHPDPEIICDNTTATVEMDVLQLDPADQQHRPSVQAKHSFPTTRRVVRRKLDTSKSLEFLETWRKEKGVKIGEGLSDDHHLRLLHVLWTYRDVEAINLKDMDTPTDLIVHRMRLKEGTPVYKAPTRHMSPNKEYWLRRIVTEGLDAGLYERTTVANGRLSPWGANAVVVEKPGRAEPRVTFNYHWVFEEVPGNQMELSNKTRSFLSIPSHKRMSKGDLKNGYWTVSVHPDDRYLLAFYVTGIGQVQPTRMAQGARSSSFTMNELGAITFGAIPSPNPEPSLLNTTPERNQDMIYYIDDLFSAHDSDEAEVKFLEEHFFPRLLWSKLKLGFNKLELAVTEVLALGELHYAGGRINLKPERVRKILEWPTPTNQTGVRAFMGTIGGTRNHVKNFSEIARPLNRLLGNRVEWRWSESEEVSFELLKQQCAHAVMLYGIDPVEPIDMYVDASGHSVGCHVSQTQSGTVRPILYDSISLSKAERNYDTYKRELKAIVTFAKKYSHMLQGHKTSTIWTDHKPLVGFLNSRTHEDIFARWAQALRALNIKIARIPGERNVVADGLSRTIFGPNCEPTEATKFLKEKLENPDDPWLWKTGAGGYEQWLKDLDTVEREKAIEDAEKRHASVNAHWISFGESEPMAEFTDSVDCNVLTTGEGPESLEQTKERWYGNLTNYYRFQHVPQDWSQPRQARFKRMAEMFRWDADAQCLLHKSGDLWVRCVGPEEIEPLLLRTHDLNGHFALKIVHEKLRDRVWWPSMISDIHKYVKSCLACTRASMALRTQPLRPIQSLRPFHILVADYIGPFRQSKAGNQYILNVVDYFSRFCMAEATPSTGEGDTLRGLTRVFDRFTNPIAAYFDQGGGFISTGVRDILRARGVALTWIPNAAHRTAGLIENANRLMRYRLATTRPISISDIEKNLREGKDMPNVKDDMWDVRLPKAVSSINHRHMVEIGYSPVEIALGVTSGELLDLEDKYPTTIRTEVLELLRGHAEPVNDDQITEQIHYFMSRRSTRTKLAHAENQRIQELRKRAFEGSKSTRTFQVGDRVLRFEAAFWSKEFSPWQGPYVIAECIGGESGVYRLTRLNGGDMGPAGGIAGITHGDRLQKIWPRTGYLLPADENGLGPSRGIFLPVPKKSHDRISRGIHQSSPPVSKMEKRFPSVKTTGPKQNPSRKKDEPVESNMVAKKRRKAGGGRKKLPKLPGYTSEEWESFSVDDRSKARRSAKKGKFFKPRRLEKLPPEFTSQQWKQLTVDQRVSARRAFKKGKTHKFMGGGPGGENEILRDATTGNPINLPPPEFSKDEWSRFTMRQRGSARELTKDGNIYHPKGPRLDLTEDEKRERHNLLATLPFRRMVKPPPNGHTVKEWMALPNDKRKKLRRQTYIADLEKEQPEEATRLKAQESDRKKLSYHRWRETRLPERKTIALPLHERETLGRDRRALWHHERSFRSRANAPEEARQDNEESEKVHENQDFGEDPSNLEILRDDEDFAVTVSIVKAAQRFHGAHTAEDLDTPGRLQWARRAAREVVLTYYESRQREADQEALLDFLESLGMEFIDLTTMTKLEVIGLFARGKAFHESGEDDASGVLGDDIPIDPRLQELPETIQRELNRSTSDSTLTDVPSDAFDEPGPSSPVMSGALDPGQLPIIWGPPPSPTIPISAYDRGYLSILLDSEGRIVQDVGAVAQDELDGWSGDDDEEVMDDVEME